MFFFVRPGSLGVAIKSSIYSRPDGAWSQLEKGLMTLAQFYSSFARECQDLDDVDSSLADPAVIKDYMDTLQAAMADNGPVTDVMEAVKALKANGVKTAILTNNWKLE